MAFRRTLASRIFQQLAHRPHASLAADRPDLRKPLAAHRRILLQQRPISQLAGPFAGAPPRLPFPVEDDLIERIHSSIWGGDPIKFPPRSEKAAGNPRFSSVQEAAMKFLGQSGGVVIFLRPDQVVPTTDEDEEVEEEEDLRRRELSKMEAEKAAIDGKAEAQVDYRAVPTLFSVVTSCEYIEMSDFLKRLRSKKQTSKAKSHGASSSSQPEMHEEAALESPMHDETKHPPHTQAASDGILLINSQDTLTRRRGKATCQDIRDLQQGTRVFLEINDEGHPYNIPESTLLASYMGVLVKDSALAPISFYDWRNSTMETFKRRLIHEIEAKISYPPNIRPWIIQALGTKWRGYKTNSKHKY